MKAMDAYGYMYGIYGIYIYMTFDDICIYVCMCAAAEFLPRGFISNSLAKLEFGKGVNSGLAVSAEREEQKWVGDAQWQEVDGW